MNQETKMSTMLKALNSLYIAVEPSIASDIKHKVNNVIEEQDEQIKALTEENERLKERLGDKEPDSICTHCGMREGMHQYLSLHCPESQDNYNDFIYRRWRNTTFLTPKP